MISLVVCFLPLSEYFVFIKILMWKLRIPTQQSEEMDRYLHEEVYYSDVLKLAMYSPLFISTWRLDQIEIDERENNSPGTTTDFTLLSLHALHRYCKCLRKHCIDRDLFLVCMQLLHLAWRIVSVCLPQEPFYAFMYTCTHISLLFHWTTTFFFTSLCRYICRYV